MVSFEDLKVSLVSFINKNRKVSHQDLLKWASSNKVGNALLYLLIRELIKDRRFKASGEYVIGILRVGNNDVRLVIPMYIEVPTQQRVTTSKHQGRQRRGKAASILETLSEEVETVKRQAEVKVEKKVETVEPRETQGAQRPEVVETRVEAAKAAETVERKTEIAEEQRVGVVGAAPADYSSMTMDSFMSILRNAIYEEIPQNREEALKVALAMLAYLSKYWSVGELRLKLDVARQFGGVDEGILRIEDDVLRILEKIGLVEIVEPGVVNRVKDLPRDFIKVRLDSLFS